MDGDAFAENIVISNAQVRDAALVFQVLRFLSDGGEGKDFIARAKHSVSIHDDVRMQLAVLAQRDVLADEAISANFTTRTDLRLGVDDGRWMNHENYELRILNYEPAVRAVFLD
jgi:hypothetical protein